MSRAQLGLSGTVRTCSWCKAALPLEAPDWQRFCGGRRGQRCRQSAFRVRRRVSVELVQAKPMRLRYDDPPYLGTAQKYYQMPEVDHAKLISEALAEGWDGYALSCSVESLPVILPLMPAGTRICAWVKPHAPSPRTHGIHNCWEVVLVVGGRQRQPGKRDWLSALPARSGGDLPGRKPQKFAAWLYELLGAAAGDELYERFPGTGIVSQVFKELQAAELQAASSLPAHDEPSSLQSGDDAPSSLVDAVDAFECAACGGDWIRCEGQPGCVDATALVQVRSSSTAAGPDASVVPAASPRTSDDASRPKAGRCCRVCGTPTTNRVLCADHDNADTRHRYGLRSTGT